MPKKILIPLIVILVAAGLVFLIAERISKSEQPLEKTISDLREEIRLIHEEVWRGEISQEETEKKLTALENRAAELITKHSLKAKVDEFVAQQEASEKLTKWAGPRIIDIELQLGGVAEKSGELAIPLMEEFSALRDEIYRGELNQEKVDEKLTALEDKITELINQQGIKSEVDEFAARYKTGRELGQLAESRIRAIDLQLGGIAEYFVQKYRIDTGTEVKEAQDLQNELQEFSDKIWAGKISQEEIDKKLSDFEEKAAELITRHGIRAEVDEYVAKIEASLERVTAIDQRIANIQLQLTALEFYLSEKER